METSANLPSIDPNKVSVEQEYYLKLFLSSADVLQKNSSKNVSVEKNLTVARELISSWFMEPEKANPLTLTIEFLPITANLWATLTNLDNENADIQIFLSQFIERFVSVLQKGKVDNEDLQFLQTLLLPQKNLIDLQSYRVFWFCLEELHRLAHLYQHKILINENTNKELNEKLSATVLKIPDLEFEGKSSDLVITKELGSGSTGKVFRGLWKGMVVAIKKFDRRAKESHFLHEVMIMKKLTMWQIPNIVQMYGHVSMQKPYSIMMECMHGGSLTSFIAARKKNYEPIKHLQEGLPISMGITTALAYLHERRIVHHDLKTENILLDPTHQEAKLADFGFAASFEEIKNKSAILEGTSTYFAPEYIWSQIFTPACEMYSAGLIFWEIAHTKNVFASFCDDNNFLYTHVQLGNREPIDPNCPASISNLITSLWHQDPKERPSAKETLERLRAIKQS